MAKKRRLKWIKNYDLITAGYCNYLNIWCIMKPIENTAFWVFNKWGICLEANL